MTDSDIVKKIAEEVGVTLGIVDNSLIVHEYVFQSNQTNMEFLYYRAALIGFELFIQDEKLYFRKPKPDNEAPLHFKLGTDLQQFHVCAAEAQVTTVIGNYWNIEKGGLETCNTNSL